MSKRGDFRQHLNARDPGGIVCEYPGDIWSVGWPDGVEGGRGFLALAPDSHGGYRGAIAIRPKLIDAKREVCDALGLSRRAIIGKGEDS